MNDTPYCPRVEDRISDNRAMVLSARIEAAGNRLRSASGRPTILTMIKCAARRLYYRFLDSIDERSE